MKHLLRIACIAEAATAAALLVSPSTVGMLLFGQELSGPAALMARIAGIALLSLAIACWPTSPVLAMFLYSVIAALFLSFVGLTESQLASGMLLWPAVAAHVALAAGLGAVWTRSMRR